MSFADRVPAYSARLEAALNRLLPPENHEPRRLHAAMRYACLGGGKRLRPLLIYATGETLGIPAERLDAPAAAVEMVHCYSLTHDDLPAMDNDDLRRGRPTCHKVFDDATAILAGDALQALAFDVLVNDPAIQAEPPARLHMCRLLAEASGSYGMAGGQALDLAAVGRQITLAELENMHIHKTGALIRASMLMACSCTPLLAADELGALDRYAKRVGLAFQVWDDVLDEEADPATLGKTPGKDRAQNKPTFPALLGMAEAKRRAHELVDEAVKALTPLGERAEPLRWLGEYIVSRSA